MSAIRVSFVLLFVPFLGLNYGKRIRLSRPDASNKFATRIIDGKNAEGGQFPYNAQLVTPVFEEFSSTRFYYQYCGGSVISNQHILTAAHCVNGAIQVSVILGRYDETVLGGQKIYAGEYVHVHDGFNRTSLENDIAVVELYDTITFSSIIKAVQLSCAYTQPNTQVQVAGSGLTSDAASGAATDIAPTLDYINLFTISNQQCSTELPYIFPSKICARGTNRQATCHGDGGAAMVETMDGTEVQLQVALVSRSAIGASCELGLPDSFTRISSFLNWIGTLVPVTCPS